MKSTLAFGLLLGASHLASARELAIGETATFGEDGSVTLTFQAGSTLKVEGGKLNCQKAYARGTARHMYQDIISATEDGDAHKPADIDKYDSKTKLAYLCGVDSKHNGANGESLGPLQLQTVAPGVTMDMSIDKVLVKFDGTFANCADKGTLTTDFKDAADKGTLDGKDVTIPVKSTIEFDCRKAEAFSVKVSSELKLEAKEAAKVFMEDLDEDPKVSTLPRVAEGTAGKDKFEVEHDLVFDLGTDAPHSAYYSSGVCSDADDKCFGALKTYSEQASSGSDKATSLSTVPWVTDSNVTYQTISACRTETTQILYGQYKQWEVCFATKGTATGGDGLLTQYDCPFIEGTTLSTVEAAVDCEKKGKELLLDIECKDFVGTNSGGDEALVAKNISMGDPDFFRPVEFNGDGNVFQKVNQLDIASGGFNKTQKVRSGSGYVTWSIPLDNSTTHDRLSKVTELQIKQSTDEWVTSDVVVSKDGILTFRAPPKPSQNVRLTGLIASDCKVNRETFLDIDNLKVEQSTKSAGSFVLKDGNVCDGRHEYIPPTNQTGMRIISVHSPDTTADVTDIKFCKAGMLSKGDCLNDLPDDTALQQGDDLVVISKICDTTAAGHVGALVEMEDAEGSNDYFYAPVYCGGPCLEADIDPISLDWTMTFEAGVNDEDNEITAYQSLAQYDNSTDGLVKVAFLAADDVCLASGRIFGGLPNLRTNTTEGYCGVFNKLNGSTSDTNERNFGSASTIRDAFQLCGETESDSPEVFLVQQLKVDRPGESDDKYFCHSQKLKLEVQDMTNQSIATLAQVEASDLAEAAAPISASLSSVSYEECDEGGYTLKAVIDVDGSLVSTTDIQYNHTTGEPKFHNGMLSYDTDLKLGELIFEGASCVDVCAEGSESFYTDQYTFTGTIFADNLPAGVPQSKVDIDLDFQIRGSPCDEQQTISQGKVVLTLFGKSGLAREIVTAERTINTIDASSMNCDNSSFVQLKNGEVAVGDSLCSKLVYSEMGNSYLRVIRAELSRKSPGSVPEIMTHSLFTANQQLTNNVSITSGLGHELVFDDAFATYTLKVDWEQQLNRRLLRSVHTFGAGDNEAESSLVILPASQQVSEGVETEQSDISHSTDDSADDDDEDFDWAQPGMIVLYVIVGLIVLLFGQSKLRHGDAMQSARALASGKLEDLERPKRSSYSQVRRSERFSVTRF